MIHEFKPIAEGIVSAIEKWEPILSNLSNQTIVAKRNSQNRTIKQIVGHLIDSATNNTHRIIHLQNLPSPLTFPNYASSGNNDKWIAIQDFQNEDWHTLIQLWKYSNLHLVHVIGNVDSSKLNNEWIAAPDKRISLKQMILDYQPHLKLHLSEIRELMS